MVGSICKTHRGSPGKCSHASPLSPLAPSLSLSLFPNVLLLVTLRGMVADAPPVLSPPVRVVSNVTCMPSLAACFAPLMQQFRATGASRLDLMAQRGPLGGRT